MLKRIAVVALSMTLGTVAMAADQTPYEKLVDQVTSGKATVSQTFSAVDGLTGLVIAPKGNSAAGVIGYTDKSAQYLFFGTIMDANGTNYTQQYTQTYIQSKVAKAAYADAPGMGWIADGSDKAPHKMYIVIDPNCIFCHLMYKEALSYVQSGQLQIRWIPAGFLKPTSAGMAAQMLYPSTPAKQLAVFEQNQTGFNQSQEQGGIDPLVQNDKDMTVNAAFAKEAKNTAFFEKYQFQGTPVLLLKQTDGTVTFYPGYLKGAQFKKVVDSASGSW